MSFGILLSHGDNHRDITNQMGLHDNMAGKEADPSDIGVICISFKFWITGNDVMLHIL